MKHYFRFCCRFLPLGFALAILCIVTQVPQSVWSYTTSGGYWSGGWPVVPYYINAASFPSSAGTEAQIIAAIQKGANHWNFEGGAKITLVYQGTSSLTTRDDDGTNVIYYDADDCDSSQGYCIAQVGWWPATGALTDFDITFHGKDSDSYNVTWDATDPVLFAADLWGFAAHEFGHVLGLGHSSTSFATMNTDYTEQGESYLRYLVADDIDGLLSIYDENIDIRITNKQVLPGDTIYIEVDFADSAGLDYEFVASENGTSPGIDLSATDSDDTRILPLNTPLFDIKQRSFWDITGTLDTLGESNHEMEHIKLGRAMPAFCRQN